MENNQNQVLELLREEYANCSKRIDDFNAQLVPMFNTILFIIGGYLALVLGTKAMQDLQLFTPYLLFSALGIAGYQYRRTIILQGYRMHLEGRINAMVGDKVFNFGAISKRYLLHINFFSSINSVSYFALIGLIIGYSHINDFSIVHLILQVSLLAAFVFAYYNANGMAERVRRQFDDAQVVNAPVSEIVQ